VFFVALWLTLQPTHTLPRYSGIDFEISPNLLSAVRTSQVLDLRSRTAGVLAGSCDSRKILVRNQMLLICFTKKFDLAICVSETSRICGGKEY